MSLDLITIAYFVILLIAAIIGLKRGFFKTLLGLIKTVISTAVAIFFTPKIATLFVGTGLGAKATTGIETFLLNRGGAMTNTITLETKDAVISNALADAPLPSSVLDWITKLIDKFLVLEPGQETTVGAAMAPSITYYLAYGIIFLLIFLLCMLICKLLDKIFDKLTQIPFVGGLNRLLGLVLNVAIGFILLCGISYGLSYLIAMNNGISEWLVNTMGLGNDNFSSFSKYMYENNFLLKIISFFGKQMA